LLFDKHCANLSRRWQIRKRADCQTDLIHVFSEHRKPPTSKL
jgi:hypothetical protein